MANQEQLEILKQGVKIWNQWREANRVAKIDLSGANLSGADLSGVDFTDARLTRVEFRDTNLCEARLSLANLSRATLINAFLTRAKLKEARLTEAIVVNADLRDANLSGAYLVQTVLAKTNLNGASFYRTHLSETFVNEANFSNAMFAYTTIASTDLSQVIDLEKAIHRGPSSIGIDTIYKSKGKIPEIFLRGCGLSDLEIEFARLAAQGLDPEQVTDISYKIHQMYLGSGVQYYSCFISYSSKDEEFAKRLHDDLQNNSVRCWFAPEDLKIGDQIRPTIDHQIRLRDKLLVILSENSVKSEWVGDEVEAALEEEKESGSLVLFPIRLDDAVMNTRDDWAAKIKRRRHIGDFSNWKDEGSYRKAFERLLRDLKASSGEVRG